MPSWRNDFAAPPYGASLEVLQAVVAAGVRTGLLDVRYQGALIKNPGDQRLDAVFKGPAAFRSASFRPHEDVVPAEKRVELAKRLTTLTGSKVNLATDELARHVPRRIRARRCSSRQSARASLSAWACRSRWPWRPSPRPCATSATAMTTALF